MALVTLACVCGRQWDTIIGGATIQPDPADLLCTCGQAGSRVVGSGLALKGFDYDNLDADEREALRDHRKWMEENHHKRESGEITMLERGPNEYRPFGNRPRQRKFF